MKTIKYTGDDEDNDLHLTFQRAFGWCEKAGACNANHL